MPWQLARKLLKVALRIFGAVEENRVQAFLIIRRLALEVMITPSSMRTQTKLSLLAILLKRKNVH
jgi:hypothetical protein